MAEQVFISYRRSDSADMTGRIHDSLALYFGPDLFFRDIDNIRAGQFPRQLELAIQNSRATLVVIGPHWLDATDDKGRRLDDPADFVRQEVAAALRSGKAVLPVLVSGARMPIRDQLPDELRNLVTHQAIEVRTERSFIRDVYELCKEVSANTRLNGLDFVQAISDFRRLGVKRAVVDFHEDQNTGLDAVRRSQSLLVVMNDGRSWIDSRREAIVQRIADRNRTTQIVLIHPRSPFLETLIRKNRKTRSQQLEEIHRSYNIIKEAKSAGSDARVLGHYTFNPSSLVLTEDIAIISPYFFMERGALPQFTYERSHNEALFYAIQEDARKLLTEATELNDEDFT